MDDGTTAPGAFADLLRRLRMQAALTQEELAARAGLTAKAVGALERGERRRPYPHTVRSLADALVLDDRQRSALTTAARPESAPAPDARDQPYLLPAAIPARPASRRLVGREGERADLVQLVRSGATRLLTLTGPGGVGKTSLALDVADALVADLGPPVVVELAGIRQAPLVLPAIAAALGVRQVDDTVVQAVATTIGGRRLLLVLDNVEQVLDATPQIADLLARCPALVVVATSRAGLRIGAELERPIPPLAVPAGDDAAAVHSSPAASLFLERARAAGAAVHVDEQTAPDIADICRRLDGLPLALELTAAHARFLSPRDLVARLDDAVSSPRSRDRPDRPDRHRTLRATLDWSHDLLTAEEQQLLRRLAVFVGGFDLTAAEWVFGRDVLDPLGGLVEQSLVLFDRGRYRLLEPVRQYADTWLSHAGERAEIAERAAAYFCDVATVAHAGLHSADQGEWLDVLQREHGNLNATLLHLAAGAAPEGPARAARLAASLWLYWALRGSAVEALRHVRTIPVEDVGPQGLAPLQLALAGLHYASGQAQAALAPARQSVDEARVGAPDLLTEALILTGTSAVAVGHDASAPLGEALRRASDLDDAWAAAHAGAAEGQRLLRAGDATAAAAAFADAEGAARALGNPFALATVLNGRGTLARVTGDTEGALQRLAEAVTLAVGLGTTWTLAYSLPLIGTVAAGRGQAELAAELFAAGAEAASVTVAYPPDSGRTPTSLSAIRDELGDEAFRRAWDRGRTRRPDELPALVAAITRPGGPG